MSFRARLVAFLLLGPALAVAPGAVALDAPAGPSASFEARALAEEPISRRIQGYKTDLVEATGIGKSGLHFILGGLVFVLAGLVLMRFTSNWAWWAAGVTLALAILLELVDWSDASLVGKRLTWGHTLKDLFQTCAVAAVYLAARPLFDRLRR